MVVPMTGGGETEIGRAISGAAPARDDAELRSEDAATAQLVSRIQEGDQERFAELYERYFDRVYAYLRVVLRDRHEAEDAAQQVFVQAFQGLATYQRRRQPFRAWLFTIARNHAINQLRKLGRVEPEDPAELDQRRQRSGEFTSTTALSWISDDDLLLFVERLPEAQRQVLVLRFMLGLTAAETGEVLDRTPGDVRKLQSRALAFLRERLGAVDRRQRHRRDRALIRSVKQAPVLRMRRFALLRW